MSEVHKIALEMALSTVGPGEDTTVTLARAKMFLAFLRGREADSK